MRYYPCTNQYSITALTDSLGVIKERYAYDAYGGLSVFDGSGTARTSTAESNRYTYTGREWDGELDLYHFRARMYDPVAGQFLGRDPLGYSDYPTMYAFLLHGILRSLDPFGLETVDELCQRKKREYEEKRVPELARLCPKAKVSVECKNCGEEDVRNGVLGHAECKDGLLTPQEHTLVLCLDAIKHGRSEEEAKKELITTLIHEDQHVADRCTCKRGCQAFAFTAGDIKPGGISNFCQRFYCTEVRAHCIDKSCDQFTNEVERKACIKRKLEELYNKPHERCTEDDLDTAIEKCYIPKGQDPRYPMPIT